MAETGAWWLTGWIRVARVLARDHRIHRDSLGQLKDDRHFRCRLAWDFPTHRVGRALLSVGQPLKLYGSGDPSDLQDPRREPEITTAPSTRRNCQGVFSFKFSAVVSDVAGIPWPE